jgi:SAM-dependent methyltransferase
MRVLDVGTGAGDLALSVAEVVGADGAVLGVDMNPTVLETARERARAVGLGNVTFQEADLRADIQLEGAFDAIVGRFVLTHLDNPTRVVWGLARSLRPGGIVAFSEVEYETVGRTVYPSCPLAEQAVSWLRETMRRSGADLQTGFKLHTIFLDAGLVEPQVRASAPDIAVAPNLDGCDRLVSTLQSLLPRVVETGVARAEEVDINTLAERLRQELTERRGLLIGPFHMQAWARKP